MGLFKERKRPENGIGKKISEKYNRLELIFILLLLIGIVALAVGIMQIVNNSSNIAVLIIGCCVIAISISVLLVIKKFKYGYVFKPRIKKIKNKHDVKDEKIQDVEVIN